MAVGKKVRSAARAVTSTAKKAVRAVDKAVVEPVIDLVTPGKKKRKTGSASRSKSGTARSGAKARTKSGTARSSAKTRTARTGRAKKK
jgi:hypothetical protein